MDSGGFPSSFPAGLRVLVVDDDPTWLKILEKMLKKCNYEVTTCNLAREALSLLRERKDGFDIVISDVNMPDMDGFKLLEHVGLEMDLPVIMMSVDGETSRVMKGVQHGACDYLLKPIRMKELRNIWQHVFRKRIHEGFEENFMMKSFTEQQQSEDGFCFNGDSLLGKRKKDDERAYSDVSSSSTTTNMMMMKKPRVVWTVDLHQKFVQAVNQIGFDKVGPKRILDLMGVPWLTRENVASHLQKYRLFLNRLERENELKAAFAGTTKPSQTHSVSSDPCTQASVSTTKQSDVVKENIIEPKTEASKSSLLHSIQMNQPQPQQAIGAGSSSKALVQNNSGFSDRSLVHGYGSGLGMWDNQEFNGFASINEFYPFYTDFDSQGYYGDDQAEYQNEVTEYQVIGKDLYIS